MFHQTKFHPTPSAKQTSYRYVPIQQTMESEDVGTYSTFGIQVLRVEETVIDLISDVSTDLKEVQRLADLCTERQLSPEHIRDVVDDFLNDPDPIHV